MVSGLSRSGSALQADVPEGGALLLVEERQAHRGHRGRGPRHHPHHHPAGHRSHPRQLCGAPGSRPHGHSVNAAACT